MKPLAKWLAVCCLAFVFLAGCGEDEDLKKSEEGREKIVAEADKTATNLRQVTEKLRADNENLKRSLTMLQTQLSAQDATLDDLAGEVRDLQKLVGTSRENLAAERKARAEAGWRWYTWVLVIAIVGAIGYALYLFVGRPKPFDEEGDDEFGLDEDDFGSGDQADEFKDEEKDKDEA